jgi:hypothetical protein
MLIKACFAEIEIVANRTFVSSSKDGITATTIAADPLLNVVSALESVVQLVRVDNKSLVTEVLTAKSAKVIPPEIFSAEAHTLERVSGAAFVE